MSKDWCISRQLWWGQQIPAWYVPDGSFRVAATREEAYAKFSGARAAPSALHFHRRRSPPGRRRPDTWFSSWLWPIEVFKGISIPATRISNYYYPTSVLVTGQDIIFFWVARMIMAGLYYFPDLSRPADGKTHPLPGCLFHRHGPRQARPQDEQKPR
jgi:valyl-tRNA synthetase